MNDGDDRLSQVLKDIKIPTMPAHWALVLLSILALVYVGLELTGQLNNIATILILPLVLGLIMLGLPDLYRRFLARADGNFSTMRMAVFFGILAIFFLLQISHWFDSSVPEIKQTKDLAEQVYKYSVEVSAYRKFTIAAIFIIFVLIGIIAYLDNWRILSDQRRAEKKQISDDVGLFRIGVGETVNYKIEVQHSIVQLMGKSDSVKILVVNGYDDFCSLNSPIRSVLLAQNRPVIDVLLLDPFSTFARDRANNLRQNGDQKRTWLRYIRDFVKSVEFLNQIIDEGHSRINLRIYCSRPIFRLYIGRENDETGWCVSQFYLKDEHGHKTPCYQYKYNPDIVPHNSFYRLANQAFDYIWDRSFTGFDENGLTSIPLLYYMTDMYSLSTKNSQGIMYSPDELRTNIVSYTSDLFRQAREMYP